jgi:hypothetical protein
MPVSIGLDRGQNLSPAGFLFHKPHIVADRFKIDNRFGYPFALHKASKKGFATKTLRHEDY